MTHEKQVVNYSTGEVETVNDNFVQLYVDKLDLIIEMTGENSTAVKVFVWLLQKMDTRNAIVVSQVALAEAFGVTERSIRYSIAYLKDKKAITILKSGNTNIYAVNAQIAWKSDANRKRYALFNAAVYISGSEQEKDEALFKTELVGHAVKKERKKRGQKQKLTQEEKEALNRISEKLNPPTDGNSYTIGALSAIIGLFYVSTYSLFQIITLT